MGTSSDTLSNRTDTLDDERLFEASVRADIAAMREDPDLTALARLWARAVCPYRYAYHFKWMGRPIIQVPQDILAMQELIWEVKPEVVVETGVARGGSLVFFASMLALLDGGRPSKRKVVGIDIDIRPHNRRAIENHPMGSRVDLIQGSSIDPLIVDQVKRAVGDAGTVIVCLDSNHTKEHVLAELRLYAPLVKKGSCLVVFDTLLEHLPPAFSIGRPWGPGNGPLSAVREFLTETKRFVVDDDLDAKLQITVAPGGFLRCVEDP